MAPMPMTLDGLKGHAL